MDQPFSSLDFCMQYENGDLGFDEEVAGFQHLIDSGLVNHLQGHYGRQAQRLIDAGLCHAR